MFKLKIDGPLLIIIAAALWAFDGVLRRGLYTLPPLQIVFLEHLVGSILLLPFLRKIVWQDFGKVWREMLLVIILSGLLGTLLFTAALQQVFFISFSVVFLLQKLQPLFAIASAKILLSEKFSKKYWWWAGLALIAAYFVTFPTGSVSLSEQGNNIRAALYALGAAFAWGVSTTFSKKVLLELPSSQATALRFVGTSLLAGLALIIFHPSTLAMPNLSQWSSLIFIACSTGMVALFLYYKGLQKTSVKTSTLLELVFPVLAVGIDAWLYKSFLQPVQILGALILLFALSRVVNVSEQRNKFSQV
ncbi:MAG: hypothetical protein COU63_02540 [Candidatus Pacebacteria bacterium CG10_big_fil_rev_8_21_14_0_10_36_11]|nr:DMT family transporter [Candidatus Pacearchaeota archaeon]OIP74309.1 MAG: hypothetical protein AUK08_00795 [Candidatus Pacebacteria bacterium CG2_30_36_39]PIR64872.1 MAG: hypothetical protein COU63_02540 [Candidatus Pacebacteria bacterium CG10_big_fil_rev_8_21_14_0_10_36_11]PJC43114.1 MAG: hypothetical protein CO040_00850 [Candidatus Pacebacteria bacterium CG_4_9_14_0_2_um_filter_36_8]